MKMIYFLNYRLFIKQLLQLASTSGLVVKSIVAI